MDMDTVVKVLSYQESNHTYTLDIGFHTHVNVAVGTFDTYYRESQFQFHETKDNETPRKVCNMYGVNLSCLNKFNSPQTKYSEKSKFFAGFFLRIK